VSKGKERTAPEVASDSVEADAKDRAVAVVKAWRAIDWTAAEAGETAALVALRDACEMHESARRFLLDEAGGVGVELDAGLERFYGKEVGPRLRRPALLSRLGAMPATPADARFVDEGTLVPRSRPTVTTGHTVRMNTGCGNLYVTINEDKDGQPFELFNHMGKAGGCAASQNEAIGRLISYALRCGASMEPLIKQLKGISCHRPAWGEDGKISSCSDAIGKALEKYYSAQKARGHTGAAFRGAMPRSAGPAPEVGSEPLPENDRRRLADLMSAPNGHSRKSLDEGGVQGACQDCGSQLSYEEGCVKCHSCGFTECG
jgi:hypothetical protein